MFSSVSRVFQVFQILAISGQHHYRSDFNKNITSLQQVYPRFNPIIGLILTNFDGDECTTDEKFQSHYRSDFN